MGETQLAETEVMEGLQDFQAQLRAHFEVLADQRKSIGAVVFALEHGLDTTSLERLDRFVRAGVRSGIDFEKVWLPLVVYATEIGYAYDGNEFWSTFEARTPNWQDRYDREWIRYLFRRFARTFVGAEPQGPWAQHFSIISWPITHAVLPEDLQLKLVKLIHEIRYQLREEHLSNSVALGRLLGGRAEQFPSSRIRILLENEPLVGQIAMALLHTDSESTSDLLEPHVLERLARAFEDKSNASQLLKSAQKAATRVRYRGVSRASAPDGAAKSLAERASPQQVAAVLGIEPRLVARLDPEGNWGLFGQFPRLSALAERFSPVMTALRSTQFRVNGSSRLIGRSALLFGPQSVPVTVLPDPSKPALLGSDTSHILSLYVRGDWGYLASDLWMFKIGADATARFVRNPIFRPGDEYLLIARGALSLEIPFGNHASIRLAGAEACTVSVPLHLDSQDREALEASTGWPVGSFLALKPYGLPPLSWDGHGGGEWIEDTPVMLSLAHEKSPAIVSVELQDHEGTLRNEAIVDASPNLIILEGLEVGRYDARLRIDDGADSIVEANVQIQVVDKSALDHEESIINVLADPPHSGFEDLWSKRANISIAGPAGLEVSIELVLRGGRGSDVVNRISLGERKLPLQGSDWPGLFHSVLGKTGLENLVEESASCVVVANSRVFPSAELILERRASPLRLRLRKRDGKPVLEVLNDTTENEALRVYGFEFQSPGRRCEIAVEGGHRAMVATPPGLAIAECGTNEAALIVPPEVHDLSDLRRSSRPIRPPSIPTTLKDLREALTLAALWSEGDTAGNVLSDDLQSKVLAAWNSAIAVSLAGNHWMKLEESVPTHGLMKLRKYLLDHPVRGSTFASVQRAEFDVLIQVARKSRLPRVIDEQVFLGMEGSLPAPLRGREERRRSIKFGLLLIRDAHRFDREAGVEGPAILTTLINFPQIVRLCRLCDLVRGRSASLVGVET